MSLSERQLIVQQLMSDDAVASVLWERLDTPGHDAAHLCRCGSGWLLSGAAVFRHAGRPACLRYRVDIATDWSTQKAHIDGLISGRLVDTTIGRKGSSWALDGKVAHGLDHLVDLDLGFTPATNTPQLRRIALRVGEEADVAVAWLDADAAELVELRQRYVRLNSTTYHYEAPSIPFTAALRVAESGFVLDYPTLWRAEPTTAASIN